MRIPINLLACANTSYGEKNIETINRSLILLLMMVNNISLTIARQIPTPQNVLLSNSFSSDLWAIRGSAGNQLQMLVRHKAVGSISIYVFVVDALLQSLLWLLVYI